nr:hypothetical protein [Tanacetum cinerariifolium]
MHGHTCGPTKNGNQNRHSGALSFVAWVELSGSTNTKEEGLIVEDGDPIAVDEGLAVGVEGPGVDDESYGLDGESHGIDDESHGLDDESYGIDGEGRGIESDVLGLREEDHHLFRHHLYPSGRLVLLPISPSPSVVPLPVSSPMIPLTVPSPIATSTSTISVNEDQFIEVEAQLELYRGILQDHTQPLYAMPPTLFMEIDRDVREL